MSIVGILLAAGRSERFGAEDKLLAPLKGRPLVGHAADALRALGCDRLVAVSGNDRVAAQLPGFLVVPPDPSMPGQSDSLRAGIAVARAQSAGHILIVLADMPFVTPALLAQVLAAGLHHGAACASDGKARMPPAVFDASHLPALAMLAGDGGARGLLTKIPPAACIKADPGTLIDIDTPEDLAQAAARDACTAPRGM